MHEMGLAEGVLDVVLDAADERPVKRIHLLVGKLQMVVKESFDFSFQLAAAETPAENATIEIEETPARFHCRSCGEESECRSAPFSCRSCGSYEIDVLSGDEIVVNEVELEDGVTIRNKAVPLDPAIEEHLRDDHGVPFATSRPARVFPDE